MPAVYSPDGAAIAIADELDSEGHVPFPKVNPAAWFLISSEHAPGGGTDWAGHMRRGAARFAAIDAGQRALAGVTHDLAHDLASGGSGWQGRSGELTMTDGAAMLAVTLAVQGSALDLSGRVRDAHGTMLAGAALLSAVCDWLREHDIDPDTGTSPGLPDLPAEVPAPLRGVVGQVARETAAAQTGARGAALDLNSRVRRPDGSWLDGWELNNAVATWLGTMGVAPSDAIARGRGSLSQPSWPPAALAHPGVLASVTPVPPPSLPLTARHRWVCAWALTVQTQTLAPLGQVTFHGTPAGPGTNVAVESHGRFICELANTGYRHSPTGFGAGYEGSGAAALASSLLVAALGTMAACRGCLGSGKVTWLAGAEEPVPWLPEHDQMTELNSPDPLASVATCDDCDGDGIRVHPSLYQQFKREVVARLDGDAEWHLDRVAVLAWLADKAGAGQLAIDAAGMLP